VKPRIVVGVLAVLSTLALSTTGAEAGAGGFPSPLTSFFVCQAINGDVPGRTVDIRVPALNLSLGSIKLGNELWRAPLPSCSSPTRTQR
jgi:hypothetical protein